MEYGSLQNKLMAESNDKSPELNGGVTSLHWTDRHAYKIIWLSSDKTAMKIQRYRAKRIDRNGMTDQQIYEYKDLRSQTKTLCLRNGQWYEEHKSGFSKVGLLIGVLQEFHDYSF